MIDQAELFAHHVNVRQGQRFLDEGWLRAQLTEYAAAEKSEARAKCYAGKDTTSPQEMIELKELQAKHHARKEAVFRNILGRIQ